MQIPRRPGAATAAPGAAAVRPGTAERVSRARADDLTARLRVGERLARLRAAQQGLDGETRMRRLLVGLLLPQLVLALVLLLSGAYPGLIVALLAAAAGVGVALLLAAPDQTAATGDPALVGIVDGQRAEIELLRAEASRSAVAVDLQVELARRHQALLLRQLSRIDELESREADPTALGELFALDHLATRMRRCTEGVLVLSGAGPRPTASAPVAASEVLRGAVAEVEEFHRVDVSADADISLAGSVAVDLVHLLAELVENATVFSSPATRVRVHGQVFGDRYVVTVADEGVGFEPARAEEIAALLREPGPVATASQLGYQVVARLARRHGVAVLIRAAEGGGADIAVSLPAALLAAPTTTPAGAARPVGESEPANWVEAAAPESPGEPHSLMGLDQDATAGPEPLDLEPVEATQLPEPEPGVGATEVVDAWTVDLEPAADQPAEPGELLPAAWDLEPPEIPLGAPDREPVELAWQPPTVPASGPADVSARAQAPSAPFVSPVTFAPEPTAEPPYEQAQPHPEPPQEELSTSPGLRQRTPQAHMARQMHDFEASLPGDVAAGPTPDRSRHLLSAYRDGLVLGRDGMAENDIRTHLEDRTSLDTPEQPA